jgi:hypothetical protein
VMDSVQLPPIEVTGFRSANDGHRATGPLPHLSRTSFYEFDVRLTDLPKDIR